VIGSHGVVGYVVRVFSGFSQVLWVEDPLFALEGRLVDSSQNGLVRGRGAGHDLALKYITALVPVEKGARVETTGEDGFFPPEEPIGRVVRSEDKGHRIFRTVRLESEEKLDSLWVVFVLVPPHGWTGKPLMGRQGS
jgi:rod shape-determining protein MreC